MIEAMAIGSAPAARGAVVSAGEGFQATRRAVDPQVGTNGAEPHDLSKRTPASCATLEKRRDKEATQ